MSKKNSQPFNMSLTDHAKKRWNERFSETHYFASKLFYKNVNAQNRFKKATRTKSVKIKSCGINYILLRSGACEAKVVTVF